MCDSNDNKKRERVISRIQRLLAMGKDTSSPAEAAIAMKRARAMMDAHQITELDLEDVQHSDIISRKWGDYTFKRSRVWLSILMEAVALMNDCVSSITRKFDGTKYYEFNGFEADVIVCEFMTDYLLDAAKRLWAADKNRLGLKGMSEKNDWHLGFATFILTYAKEITREREKNTTANGTALVLCKTKLIEQAFNFSDAPPRKWDCKDHSAYIAGQKAGETVHLGQFVDDDLPAASLE